MASDIRLLDRRFMPYAELLLETARRAGYPLIITSTFRSEAEQTRLYRRYLNGQSKVPALPPGRSLHAHGIAFDAVPARYPRSDSREAIEVLAALGALWKSWGGEWGGDAKIGFDPVHFQAKALFPGRPGR